MRGGSILFTVFAVFSSARMDIKASGELTTIDWANLSDEISSAGVALQPGWLAALDLRGLEGGAIEGLRIMQQSMITAGVGGLAVLFDCDRVLEQLNETSVETGTASFAYSTDCNQTFAQCVGETSVAA